MTRRAKKKEEASASSVPPLPTFAEFERATFDAATSFFTLTIRGRSGRERVEHGLNLEAALAHAAATPRTVAYALALSGRAIVLDRKDWPAWRMRLAERR